MSLIQAQYAYKEALDGIRRLIGADLKRQTRYMEIVLEDAPGLQSQAALLLAMEERVSKALRDRPELSSTAEYVREHDVKSMMADVEVDYLTQQIG